MDRYRSALGILVMLGLAFVLCPRERRRQHDWRTISRGLLLLILVALLVLRTPARYAFTWANAIVGRLLEFSAAGKEFLFGNLVSDQKTFGYIFAFQALATIPFFAALMSIGYHSGLLPWIIRHTAKVVCKILHTSGAETFSTLSDVFVGPIEAPLAIRPYLPSLTLSELMACLVGGFATTSGAVLASYVSMLQDYVPEIAGHLIACSVMSAPASLVIAKLMMPETEQPVTQGAYDLAMERTSENMLDAIVTGSAEGLRIAAYVGAVLLVFLSLTAVANGLIGWVGLHAFHRVWSLEACLGSLFSPLAWALGVPANDVKKVGQLLGEKTVMNEFVAYAKMARQLADDPTWLSDRSRLIASYALCGFANFGSIGVQISGYSSLAPERRGDLSRLGLRAMVGGLLATCLVACVAGVLL